MWNAHSGPHWVRYLLLCLKKNYICQRMKALTIQLKKLLLFSRDFQVVANRCKIDFF